MTTEIRRMVAIFALMFVAISLLAATPLVVTTITELARVGPPPIVFDDERVAGQVPMTAWPKIFWNALFNFDPPASLDALVEDYWWPVEKALLVTGAAVLVLITSFLFLMRLSEADSAATSPVFLITGYVGILAAAKAYESVMGVHASAGSGPKWGLITYGVGVVGVALFRAYLANRRASATAADTTADPASPA